MFSQQRVQRRLRPHLPWKFTQRGQEGTWGRACEWFFIGTFYKAILHSSSKNSYRFSFPPFSRLRNIPLSLSLLFLYLFPPSSISAPIFLSPFATAVSFFFFIYERILTASTYMVPPVRPSIEQITSRVASPTWLQASPPRELARRSSSRSTLRHLLFQHGGKTSSLEIWIYIGRY